MPARYSSVFLSSGFSCTAKYRKHSYRSQCMPCSPFCFPDSGRTPCRNISSLGVSFSGTHVQTQRGNVLGPSAYVPLFPEVSQDIVFVKLQFIQRLQQEAKILFRVSQSPMCRGIGTKEVLYLRVFPLGEAPVQVDNRQKMMNKCLAFFM